MRPTSPRDILRLAQVPAFLVSNLTNIKYLTGLTMTAGLLLVTPRTYILFADSRYSEGAKRSLSDQFEVRDPTQSPVILAKINSCGFECDQVTVDRFGFWKKKFKNTKFVQKEGIVEEFRRSKEDDELRLLRRAERITEELLRRIPAALRVGVTEEKLARQITIWALELGADGCSFDPIVGFGTHTSSPHHTPTSRALKKGHIVQIDIGAKYKGYCADRSEVFFTAKPTSEQATVYQLLCDAQRAAMKAAKPGASTQKLDQIARDVLKKGGIDHAFTHSLGHGVGLDIHEGVTLSSRAPAQKLLKGEVVTVEPGAYFPGKFGMRVEKMVYVG
jgi:Xaa-Pro aminopeptidase